ncbi:MAG: hypothetical protein LQ344_005902 [Seirophora lacunosa]|nr:MAG: hypothetical protein LQ344_005902 [Seirophora lacunosa]
MGRLSSVLATLRTIFATSDLDLQGACGVTPVVVVSGAFQDIYGIGNARRPLAKDPKLYAANTNGVKDSIAGYVDDQNHSRQRRLLSHVFSERALLDQERIIVGHIDYFIRRLREARLPDTGSGKESGKVDMRSWFNYLTFDITGDLMFAETFGCLENNELHPWIAIIFNTLKGIAFLSVMDHFSVLRAAKEHLLPRLLQGAMQKHLQYSAKKADKRIAMGASRADFMGYIMKNGLCDEQGVYRDNEQIMSRGEIHANSFLYANSAFDKLSSSHIARRPLIRSSMTIAGSETTATLLSGCLFYLCRNPLSMQRTVDEIRSAFATDSSIQARECAMLDYLNAAIKEALRLYPPLVTNLPRITPAGGCVIDGHLVPGNVTVSTHHYASYHASANFARPEEFLPTRWLDDRAFYNDSKDVLQPFSLGPRNCLGKNLAYLEMRLILAKLLHHFDVEICPESAGWIKQNVYIIWEKPALMVKLTDRATSHSAR